MSSNSISNQKLAPTKETGDNKTDLSGWENMGYYGSCVIYAKGDKRRLIDPKTGQSIFEYKIAIRDIELSKDIKEHVILRRGKGERNARL
jgi:hypothetical protein